MDYRYNVLGFDRERFERDVAHCNWQLELEELRLPMTLKGDTASEYSWHWPKARLSIHRKFGKSTMPILPVTEFPAFKPPPFRKDPYYRACSG